MVSKLACSCWTDWLVSPAAAGRGGPANSLLGSLLLPVSGGSGAAMHLLQPSVLLPHVCNTWSGLQGIRCMTCCSTRHCRPVHPSVLLTKPRSVTPHRPQNTRAEADLWTALHV